MPKIFPFRGLTFDGKKVPSLTQAVTQPYDRIDDALRAEYEKRSPHNIVRIDYGKTEASDGPSNNRYTRAAALLKQWREAGVFAEDGTPALYVYHQIYKVGKESRTRKGVIAALQLEEFGKGSIRPHEQTHDGPKADRLKLMTALGTVFDHVFMLYTDPKKQVNALLDPHAKGAPALEARDDAGETHRVWRVTDPAVLQSVQQAMAGKDAFIADGHHRYETALNFREAMRKAGKKAEGTETPDNRLVTFVNMEDEGLTIFATHRLVYDVPKFDPAALTKALETHFDLHRYELPGSQEELLEDLRFEGMDRPAIGIAFRDRSEALLAVLRDPAVMDKLITDKKSSAWKQLDVNVLHTAILEKHLGIGPAQLAAEKNVDFLRHADAAIAKVRAPGSKYAAAFLINPITVPQIQSIVKQGERFPQKTTDFYPKLITGLVGCRYRFV